MSALSVSALLPAGLIVHALAIVATLATSRRVRWCRRLTFGGSALASALTTAAAASVLASGQPLAGVLFAHEASGLVVDYVVTPLSAWFLVVLGARGDSGRPLQHRLPGPCHPPVSDGRRRRGVQRPHRRRERGVHRQHRGRLSVRLGDDDARDRRARRDRARDADDPACRVLVSRSCRTSARAPWSRRS